MAKSTKNTVLKIAIIQANTSQRKLAKKLRITDTRMSRIVSRDIPPTETERSRIAKAVHYDEAVLWPEFSGEAAL